MKKTILLLITFILLAGTAQAVLLENETWWNPSQTNYYYVVNKTIEGITIADVNQTCVTINTTNYCSGEDSDYLMSVQIIVTDAFKFNITDIGMEWIKINWTSTPNVSVQYSLDNTTWYNVSVIQGTEGIQYALPAETVVYVRAKNDTTAYQYQQKKTLWGGLNQMELAMMIGAAVFILLFVLLTVMSRTSHPFLANFFFLGIFIFSTIGANIMYRISLSSEVAAYATITFLVYRVMLWVTMTIIFIVLILVTVDSWKIRKWKNNPIDEYRDNLDNN